MDLEKELLGDKRFLKYDKESDFYCIWILDAECDPLEVIFEDEHTIRYNCKQYDYICLTTSQILELHEMLEEVSMFWGEDVN
jgi:hypothetical protein